MNHDLEKYLIIISEIALILIAELFYYYGFYLFSIICFIGSFIIWIAENGNVHKTVFLMLIISGGFFVIIFGDFLFGTVLILIACVEPFLYSSLKGYH